MNNEVKITSRLDGVPSVLLNGVDVAPAARGLKLFMEAGDVLPRLELDLPVYEVGFEGEDVEVLIPDETREVLKRLGWTEPAEVAK